MHVHSVLSPPSSRCDSQPDAAFSSCHLQCFCKKTSVAVIFKKLSARGPFTAKRMRLRAKRQRPARRSLLPNARLTTSASQHWRWGVPQNDKRRSGLLVVGAAQVAQMPTVPAATTGVSERCAFPHDMVPASWLLCAWLGRRLRLTMMTHS